MKNLMKDTIKTLSIVSVTTLTTLGLIYGTAKLVWNHPAVDFDAKNHYAYISSLRQYGNTNSCLGIQKDERQAFWQKFLKENNLIEDKRGFIQNDRKQIKVSELYKIIDNWST